MNARSTSSVSGDSSSVLDVVAEPVEGRFERGKRLHIGLLLRSVRAPGRELDFDVVPGVLGRLLDGGAPAKDDQVSERDLLPAST